MHLLLFSLRIQSNVPRKPLTSSPGFCYSGNGRDKGFEEQRHAVVWRTSKHQVVQDRMSFHVHRCQHVHLCMHTCCLSNCSMHVSSIKLPPDIYVRSMYMSRCLGHSRECMPSAKEFVWLHAVCTITQTQTRTPNIRSAT